MLFSSNECGLARGLVLLAPSRLRDLPFKCVSDDPARHQRLLVDAQRLRGKTYVQDGALDARILTSDGRHVQQADYESWHLLTVGPDERVQTCLRYRAHAPGVNYTDLSVYQSMRRQPAAFAGRVKRAVQAELMAACQLGFSCVELGAWVVSEELRCSTEAVRMLLMMYSFSQILGGAIALSTATTRHSSSSILRRIGGSSLMDGHNEVTPYFDPEYDCEMELLSFDSRFPNPRYTDWIREFREILTRIPVIWSSVADVSSAPSIAYRALPTRASTVSTAAAVAC